MRHPHGLPSGVPAAIRKVKHVKYLPLVTNVSKGTQFVQNLRIDLRVDDGPRRIGGQCSGQGLESPDVVRSLDTPVHRFAGILLEEAENIAARYSTLGLQELARPTMNDWCAFLYRR